jgi:uncharacterized repeat protein (TIGR02543 family)
MQVNNNQSNGGFSMFKKVFGVMALASTMLLFVCDTDVGPVAVTKYTVTYNGNGNTGGAVPTDMNSYAQNAAVAVLGNTGSLVKTGYTFADWNTVGAGNGIPYVAGATFAMGAANVVLYAQWTAVPLVITDFRLANNIIPGWTETDSTDLAPRYTSGAAQLLYGPMNGGATKYIDQGGLEYSYQNMKKDTNEVALMVIDFGTAAKAKGMLSKMIELYSYDLPLGTHSADSIIVRDNSGGITTFSHFDKYYFEFTFSNFGGLINASKAAETFISTLTKRIR